MLKSLLKRLKQKQHEDLTQPIILGKPNIDGQLNYELTSKRINDIIRQLKKLENNIEFKIHEPIIYRNINGYWTELTLNMTTKTTCEIFIEVSIFIENWLDRNNLIKPDTRPLMKTMRRYHTREIIFNEPQTIYTFLEIIRKASKEIALSEIEYTQTRQRLTNSLKEK